MLFIYLFLAVQSLVLRGLFFSCNKQGCLQLQCAGFPLKQLLLLWSTGSRAHVLQWLCYMDSVVAAPRP